MVSFNEFSTVPTLLRNVVKNIHKPEETFLIHKKGANWEEISFKETLAKADAVSAFFLEKGIVKGDRLGLMMENSPEYVYYDQGIQQIGVINVSIYPTLSEQEVAYIINDSGIKAILVGNPFLFRKILKVADNCEALKYIIPAFADFGKIAIPEGLNLEVIDYNIILDRPVSAEETAEIDKRRAEVHPNDVSSLIYTSGTTGTPKGV
ncbi:MAG: long-chain fatty acid--CoA ligase, partial [Pedobacter sp.]